MLTTDYIELREEYVAHNYRRCQLFVWSNTFVPVFKTIRSAIRGRHALRTD
jgi:hypothetical protein